MEAKNALQQKYGDRFQLFEITKVFREYSNNGTYILFTIDLKYSPSLRFNYAIITYKQSPKDQFKVVKEQLVQAPSVPSMS